MANIYNSNYSGLEVDNAVRDKTTAVTQEQFTNLSPASMPVSRIYIITDGDYANSLWRSDGQRKIALSSGGGGSGATVTPITSPDQPVLAGKSSLAGITINGYTFRICYITINDSYETMTIAT